MAHNARFAFPKIATSRSALQCLGFTAAAVEEIWAYASNPMSATPMLTNSVPNRASEFWNRVQTWMNDRILQIEQTQLLNPNISSRELLDHLGLRDAAQIQYYQHNAPPIFGGSKKFCLVQVIESDVLKWAKKIITRKWNALETLEYCIFRGGNQIDELGWADVVKEFTHRPIDSDMAYVSDPTFLLPTEELRLKSGF